MKNKIDAISTDALRKLAFSLKDKTDPAVLALGAEKIGRFLNHVGSSAHRGDAQTVRWQDRVIEEEIPVGSTVLDLGCGEGDLLARLMDMKQVRGQGVELDPEAVLQCVAKGVPVLQLDLNRDLQGAFKDNCFDYVVLEETLQTLVRPDLTLELMLQVGRRGIVTFPNFGNWRVRLDLGMRGRMPQTDWLPFSWYNTPNIHLFTLQDFMDWADEAGVHVVDGYVLIEGEVRKMELSDNLYADEALVILERKQG